MTSPARLERDSTTLAPPKGSTATGIPINPDVRGLLHVEQAKLQRDLLLWQRWVRYLAVGTLTLLSLAYSSTTRSALIPIILVAAAYGAIVAGTSAIVRRTPATAAGSVLSALLLATDIGALAAFCYFTSSPQELHRVLLLGVLPMQVGVFYFGRAHGWFGAGLTVVAYLVLLFGVPSYLPGS